MSIVRLRGWSVLSRLHEKWKEGKEDEIEENKSSGAKFPLEDWSVVLLRPLVANLSRCPQCHCPSLMSPVWLAFPRVVCLAVHFGPIPHIFPSLLSATFPI